MKVNAKIGEKSVHVAKKDAPLGHMQPLGHADFAGSWAGEIDVLEGHLDPKTFWTKYRANSRPFLLKGAALKSRAINWTDDDIHRRFGRYSGKTEWKNEDRLTDYCGQRIKGDTIFCPRDTIPYVETRLGIGDFLDRCKDPSYDKYIISQMPDEMADDFLVPGVHLCGKRSKYDRPADAPWLTQMYENNFWYVANKPDEMATSALPPKFKNRGTALFSTIVALQHFGC